MVGSALSVAEILLSKTDGRIHLIVERPVSVLIIVLGCVEYGAIFKGIWDRRLADRRAE